MKGESTMTKRIISMLLALSMLLSICPVSAFADPGGRISFAPSGTAEPEAENENNDEPSTTDLRINQNGYPYKYTEGQAAGNLDGSDAISDGTGWEYKGGTLYLNSGSYYFGAEGDVPPTGYAFAGHPACENKTEHTGCYKFYRIALACNVEIGAGASVYAIGMQKCTILTNSGTAAEVSGSDEAPGSIMIVNNEGGTIQHLYLNCTGAAGSVKNHGTITDSMLGNFIIKENDGMIESTLLSGCPLASFKFDSFSKCAFLTVDENPTLQSANLVVLRYGKDASDNYYGWFDFGYGEQHYAYFQDGFALTDEDSEPLFSTKTSMENIFSINGRSVKDAAERIFTYDSDNDCYALTTLPAAGTVLELNAPVPLTIDATTHLPRTDLAYQDSDGLYCGPGWKFRPANAEDGIEALLYLTAGTDLSGQPAVGCKVQVYKDVTIKGGTFAEQVSGYVDEDSTIPEEYTVSRGVFRLQPQNTIHNANERLSIDLPNGTNTLNGMEWQPDSNNNRFVYVYGSDNAIELTHSGLGQYSYLFPKIPGSAVPLTEAQKKAIQWKDDNGTISMTVGYNMDIGDNLTLKELFLGINVYDSSLLINDSGKDRGKPNLDDAKHTGTLYEGKGWTYDSDKDILTITTKDLLPHFSSDLNHFPVYISSQVVYKGGSLNSGVVLAQKPTGEGSDAYHSITFEDGTTFHYYDKDLNLTSEPISALWVQNGCGPITLQLTLPPNKRIIHVYNINGNPISSYDVSTETLLSEGKEWIHFKSGIVGENLVLNQTLPLTIGTDGYPVYGKDAVVGGTDANGRAWYYNSRILFLQSGSFDFSDQPLIKCHVSLMGSASITDGKFGEGVSLCGTGTVSGGISTNRISDSGYARLNIPASARLNDATWADSGSVDVYIYYDDTRSITLTTEETGYWLGQSGPDATAGSMAALTDAQKTDLAWNAAPGKLTLTLNQEAKGKFLRIEIKPYKTDLAIGTDGKPVVDDSFAKDAAGNYLGTGWKYNKNNDQLTITGTVGFNDPTYISSKVEIVAGSTLGNALLEKQPTGAGSANYHSVSLDANVPDSAYLSTTPTGEAQLRALWMAEGTTLTYHLNGTRLYNINGKDPTAEDPKATPSSFIYTMGDADLVVNRPVKLGFDADGQPTADGTPVSNFNGWIGGTDNGGSCGWYYEEDKDDQKHRLFLDYGTFDFAGQPVINCSLFAKDADITLKNVVSSSSFYRYYGQPEHTDKLENCIFQHQSTQSGSHEFTLTMPRDASVNGLQNCFSELYAYGDRVALTIEDPGIKNTEHCYWTVKDKDGKPVSESVFSSWSATGNALTVTLTKDVPSELEFKAVEYDRSLSFSEGKPQVNDQQYETDGHGTYYGDGWEYNVNTDTLSITADVRPFISSICRVKNVVFYGPEAKLDDVVFTYRPTAKNGGADNFHAVSFADGTTFGIWPNDKTAELTKIWVQETNAAGTNSIYLQLHTDTTVYNVNGRNPGNVGCMVSKNDHTILLQVNTEDLVLNEPISLQLDDSGYPKDSHSGHVDIGGDGWLYLCEDQTLYLQRGQFNLSNQPVAKCDVRLYSGAALINGAFCGRVYVEKGAAICGGTFGGTVTPDTGSTISGGIFNMPLVDGLPFTELQLQQVATLNGIDWAGTAAYVYGPRCIVALTTTANGYWAATSDLAGSGDLVLTEVQKKELGWMPIGNTLSFAPDESTRGHRLSISVAPYDDMLRIENGKPVIDESTQMDGTDSIGIGWRYDPNGDKLTITGTVSLEEPTFISSAVELGTNGKLTGTILARQPTGTGNAASYHRVALYTQISGSLYTTEMQPKAQQPTLWVCEGVRTRYYLTGTRLYNLNGNAPTLVQDVGSISAERDSFVYTMGKADLVMNEPLELRFDGNGMPDTNTGSAAYGIGGFWNESGSTYLWYSENQDLYLDSGTFDLKGQRVRCDRIWAGADVTVKNAAFDGIFQRHESASGTGTLINCVFEQQPQNPSPFVSVNEFALTVQGQVCVNEMPNTNHTWYAYGDAVSICITSQRTLDYWTAQDENGNDVRSALTDWQGNGSTLTFTLTSAAPRALTVKPEQYEYGLKLDREGKPIVSENYRHDADRITYSGSGWSYNTRDDVLTVTDSTYAMGNLFCTSKVVLSGSEASLIGITLTRQPTMENGASAIYHTVAYADESIPFTLEGSDLPLTKVWMPDSEEFLSICPNENVPIRNINGQPVEQSAIWYSNTILGLPMKQDLTLNASLLLQLDNDGYPVGSDSGRADIGGDGWDYQRANQLVTITGTVAMQTGTQDAPLDNALSVCVADGGVLTDAYVSGSVNVETGGRLVGGRYTGTVTNAGTITGGTFAGNVIGTGVLTGGAYSTRRPASCQINGPQSTLHYQNGTTFTVNGILKDLTELTVVGAQKVSIVFDAPVTSYFRLSNAAGAEPEWQRVTGVTTAEDVALNTAEAGFEYILNLQEYTADLFTFDAKTRTVVWAANAPGAEGTDDGITVRYYDADDNLSALTAPGEYTAKIFVEGTWQYLPLVEGQDEPLSDASWKFTLTKPEFRADDIAVTVPDEPVYDGNPHEVTAQNTSTNDYGAVTVRYFDASGTALPEGTLPTNAGEYGYEVHVAGSDAYEGGLAAKGTFYINRKPLTAADFNIRLTADQNSTALVYDLNDLAQQGQTAAVPYGAALTGAEVLDVTGAQTCRTAEAYRYYPVDENGNLLLTEGSAQLPTAPGTYQISIHVVPEDNYSISTYQLSSEAWRFVLAAAPSEPDKPGEPEAKTYKLTVTGADAALEDGTPLASGTGLKAGTVILLKAYEDTSAEVFAYWIADGYDLTEDQLTNRELRLVMPENDVTLSTSTRASHQDPGTDAPGASIAAGVGIAAGVVGGSLLVYGVTTEVLLQKLLPAGMAVPANREQLAVALWTAAGKPAAQSSTVFRDVPAESESLQAIRWAVEHDLLSADDGDFNPDRHVTRVEVIRVWNSFRQSGI